MEQITLKWESLFVTDLHDLSQQAYLSHRIRLVSEIVGCSGTAIQGRYNRNCPRKVVGGRYLYTDLLYENGLGPDAYHHDLKSLDLIYSF